MYQNVQFDNLPKHAIQQSIEMFNSTIYRNVSVKLKYKLFFLFMYDSTADRNVSVNLKYKLLFVSHLGSIQQFIEMFDSTIYQNVQFDNLSKRAIQQSIEMFDSTIY
ncbi:unnamed protein product [Rotaria sordida]|uniref:Uncharacterized protein n=2 Tax=Rotaria sordida TaxID=392033 RepID=A0A816B0L7_9BILA|nr:unnamed protein product [Rotaria sordida]CAF1601609.1 unnamed protein product [Rotaria sordida]